MACEYGNRDASRLLESDKHVKKNLNLEPGGLVLLIISKLADL